MPLPGLSLLGSLTRRLGSLLPARPPVRTDRRLRGLLADVQVTYTEGGIPHVEAQGARDLFFAQGYLCAADRLFQMDLSRRIARGTLSEIFGAREAPWRELSAAFQGWSLVDLDVFLRQLALVPVARESVQALSPDVRALAEAYAAGVNAAIEHEPRPLECQLLGYAPLAWTPTDSALVWKALAFQLSYGWRAGLVAEALRARFPDDRDKARALLPDQRDVTDVLPPFPGAAAALVQLETLAGKRRPGGGGLGGSNAWAIAGSRTQSGRALLCGDPHLALRAPAPGWLAHLSGGGFDVAGWCLPGVPGVVVGHNERVAWSVTTGCVLDATWALEQISAGGDEVRTAEGFAPLRTEQTDVFVRGEKAPVRRQLRFSANGPVFESALLPGLPANHALALRWTGHLPTPDLESVIRLDLARDGATVREAAAKCGSPAMNVVWADVDGHVGWTLAGVLPRFRGRPPFGIVPGWSTEHEWDGLEPPEQNPSLTDPADGLVVSANQRLVPTASPLQLGELFEAPYRARRIRKVLESLEKPDLDAAAALQLDRHSGFGVELRDTFLRPFSDRLGAHRPKGLPGEVLTLACAWNGLADPDSAGAAAVHAFAGAISETLLRPLLGDRLHSAWIEQHGLSLLPFVRLLAARGRPLFSPEVLDAGALVALDLAARHLVRHAGRSPRAWRLDAISHLTLRHLLSDLPVLKAIVTLGPFPWAGDSSTPNCAMTPLDLSGRVAAGPVLRHAVECGDWDRYRVVLATGQGGDPTTWRYREHLARWLDGGHFTLPFTPEAIRRAATATARLSPPEAP